MSKRNTYISVTKNRKIWAVVLAMLLSTVGALTFWTLKTKLENIKLRVENQELKSVIYLYP